MGRSRLHPCAGSQLVKKEEKAPDVKQGAQEGGRPKKVMGATPGTASGK